MYIEFLCENRDQLRDKLSRKSQKVFLHMSFTIASRTPEQCRTHHQKMVKYHHTLDNIVFCHRHQGALPSAVRSRKERAGKAVGRELDIPEGHSYRLEFLEQGRVLLLIRCESIQEY